MLHANCHARNEFPRQPTARLHAVYCAAAVDTPLVRFSSVAEMAV